jgi:hypothetical protein
MFVYEFHTDNLNDIENRIIFVIAIMGGFCSHELMSLIICLTENLRHIAAVQTRIYFVCLLWCNFLYPIAMHGHVS